MIFSRKPQNNPDISGAAIIVYNALKDAGWIFQQLFKQITNNNLMVKYELKNKGLIIETIDGDVLARKTTQERAE